MFAKRIFLSKSIHKNVQHFSTYPNSTFLPANIVEERVFNVFQKIKSSPSNIQSTAHLTHDLGFDSHYRREVINSLSKEFCISLVDAADNISYVQDAIDVIARNPKAR